MTIIPDRTHFATNANLARILEGARQVGELHLLYWMIEMKVSTLLTGGRQPILVAAAYPTGWIPLVPVGPDPQRSQHAAELLLAIFKDANRGRPLEFGLSLTAQDLMAKRKHYEWGTTCWDSICVYCGTVWPSTTIAEEVCPYCLSVAEWGPSGNEAAGR